MVRQALAYVGLAAALYTPLAFAVPSPCESCATVAPIIDSANVGNTTAFVQVAIRQNGQVQWAINSLPEMIGNLEVAGSFCPSGSMIASSTSKRASETDMQTHSIAFQAPARVVGFGYGCETTPHAKRQLPPSQPSDTFCPAPTCFASYDPSQPNWLVRDFVQADNGNQVRAIVHNNFMLNITVRNDALKVNRQLLACLDGSSRTVISSDVTNLAYEVIRGPALSASYDLTRSGTSCTSILRTRPDENGSCEVDNFSIDNIAESLPASCRTFIPTISQGQQIWPQSDWSQSLFAQ